MNNFLKKIVTQTKERVLQSKQLVSFDELVRSATRRSPNSFKEAIGHRDQVNIIAEIKKASPAKGLICPNFDPLRYTRQYMDGSAAAISCRLYD
jgi:indole-3-glycerol phosphate synthase